jgi:hypothetical protein
MILYIPFRAVVMANYQPGYLLVSLGGALIGLGGLLLAFMRAGRPILSQDVLYRLLPVILFLMSLSFVGGFTFY